MSKKLFERQSILGQEAVNLREVVSQGNIRLKQLPEKERRLANYKAEFIRNHEKLMKEGEETNDYFVKKYFETITEIFEEIGAEIARLYEQSELKVAENQEDDSHQDQLNTSSLQSQIEEKVGTPLANEDDNEDLNKIIFFDQARSMYKDLIQTQGRLVTYSNDQLDDELKIIDEDYEILDEIFNQVDKKTKKFPQIFHEMKSIRELKREIIRNIKSRKNQLTEEPEATKSKLVDIKTPVFDGEISEWTQFHDLFMSVVHSKKMPKVDKLYYLKQSLRGDAAQMIQHLKITDANYEAAWEILKQRFDNRRLMFTTLIDKILEQPLVNNSSAASVKKLLDTTNNCIHGLKSMGIELSSEEPLIARIIIRKFDSHGLHLYEQSVKKTKEIQTLTDVMEFLEQQFHSLEAVSKQQPNDKFQKKRYSDHQITLVSTKQMCLYCKRSHSTTACYNFLKLSKMDRLALVKRNNWCQKCLSHMNKQKCQNNQKCSTCGSYHHTVLHVEEFKRKNDEKPSSSTSLVTKEDHSTYFLPTALVKVRAATGELVTLKAIIDHASQISSISEEASQILKLPKINDNLNINGLGCTEVGVPNRKVKITIHPHFKSDHIVESEAWVLPSVIDNQPTNSFKIDTSQWKNYILADPMFNKSDRIDLLLGGKVFLKIMKKEIPHVKGDFLAQSTTLGWIVCGLTEDNQKPTKLVSAVTNLERFWELEEVPSTVEEATEDKQCIDNYEKTTYVDADGKIVVKLPLQKDCDLGDSRKQAMARFLSLERRLESNTKMKDDYVKFIREYLELGHMVEVKKNHTGKYYLPHQPVIRESSLTTKLRVVFDASAKTTNGRSLNEIMLIGPKLQRDLFDIILNWRVFRYALTADVEKMYRQVKVIEDDQLYQYILWRENKSDPIKEYKLTTVTYGTASAPFLAIKSLFYIADCCSEENTLIKDIIKSDFYMDDLMTGADTISQCKKIQHDLTKQLMKFGFHLRKWLSNEKEVTSNIDNSDENELIIIKDDESVKTLGLQWDPNSDSFVFNINFNSNSCVTKRQALSEVARIFDPLGWLSPVTIVAKLFIQKLWLLQSAWDEVLSKELNKEWSEFTKHLPELQQIEVPRWIGTTGNSQIELHGFADASEKAYAAVIYAKTEHSVILVTSKTKVNPIKNRKTLPKLELCAAHLLAKLLQKVASIVKCQHTIYAWSDSTITLSWINNKTNKDKFVRNKVSDIRSLVPEAIWNHVSSKENPADVASRGICARKFKNHSLWWNGPEWLVKSAQFWPKKDEDIDSKNITSLVTLSAQTSFVNELIAKHSNFGKLQRVLAYVLRFVNRIRGKLEAKNYLEVSELDAAEKLIILHQQGNEFQHDITELRRKGQVSKNSKIASLCPFIDKDGILRVGGRLQNSNLPYNKKHPMILKKSHLADIIIQKIHFLTLHGGNKLVESTLRQRYWIINGRNSIKKCIRSCPKCIRYRQEASKQLMGNLPMSRVTESYPFFNTGVDYAGPVHIRCSKGRGIKTYKGYIAVFVCMATKAVHLEAVSDLTTEAFMAALKRFFARRGTSAHIYSDNGTNFVGANKKLDADFKAAVKNNVSVIPILAAQKIQWHFIPPAAPQFGGIWEAGVKSMKYHLKRIIGETKLTFEEMSTLLAQIEAVLNSRPLLDVSNENIDAVDVLTPGHFLIGRPVIDCPEHVEESRISSLNRWKLIQKLRKDFWNRWKNEYLMTLQQRSKWRQQVPDLQKGTVVLVKDEATVPAKWPLGRIIEVHKGKDDKVRVVTLKLQNSTLKRPIHKVCVLPMPDEPDKEEIKNTTVTSACTVTEQPKQRKMWFWLLLLLTMTSKAKAAPQKYNTVPSIQNISANTALYLDNVGQMNVINSRWNLIIYYDLTKFQQEMEHIQILIKKIKTECPIMQNYKDACDMVITTMNRRYYILKQNNGLLIRKERQKRAPFEFMGSIYHILFGMMDADDRKLMEENMRNLFDNQENLKKLAKEQTSVVDSTVNILKKTTAEMNDNFNKMFLQLKSFYAEIQKSTNTERLISFFHVITTQLNLMLDDCEKIQSAIMSILIDINHGHINPDLLTVEQLQTELSNIEKSLPDGLILPGKNTNTELKEVYNTMSAKGIMVDNRLVIQMDIPLMNKHNAEVYKIIRLPVQGNKSAMIPRVDGDYIVYNFATNLYFLISQAQINTCTKNLQEQYNCNGNIAWKPATERSCEVSALKQSRHAECNFEEVAKKSVWEALSRENHWIFTVFDRFTLSVDCGLGNRSWMTLPLKGILSLPPGCTAIYEGVTLTASLKFSTQRSSSIQTSSWSLDIDNMESKLVKPFDVTIVNNTKDIESLLKQVRKLKATDIELKTLQFHHLSGHASLTLMTILILIAVGVYIKYKCCNSRKTVVKLDFSPPAPLRPRQNVQD